MPKGSCDPGPGNVNTLELAKGNGTVSITVHYGWDGTSVVPNCDGPIVDIRLRNLGNDTWIVQLPNGRLAKNRPILPGTDQTFTGAQAASIGLETAADIAGLTLVPAPA